MGSSRRPSCNGVNLTDKSGVGDVLFHVIEVLHSEQDNGTPDDFHLGKACKDLGNKYAILLLKVEVPFAGRQHAKRGAEKCKIPNFCLRRLCTEAIFEASVEHVQLVNDRRPSLAQLINVDVAHRLVPRKGDVGHHDGLRQRAAAEHVEAKVCFVDVLSARYLALAEASPTLLTIPSTIRRMASVTHKPRRVGRGRALAAPDFGAERSAKDSQHVRDAQSAPAESKD